jgi:PLP dependent protein
MEARAKALRDRMRTATFESSSMDTVVTLPTLIAVSKTHPLETILAARDGCQLEDFGENFVDELLLKARTLSASSKDAGTTIRWHFIGLLQSGKITKLCRQLPLSGAGSRLEAVHSLYKRSHASLLNHEWRKRASKVEPRDASRRLKVFLQVNTSESEHRVGLLTLDHVRELARFILDECPSLQLEGLSCVAAAPTESGPPRASFREFQRLWDLKSKLEDQLALSSLRLSMGMSGDFEEAIQCGSDYIRIGTALFGPRAPPP